MRMGQGPRHPQPGGWRSITLQPFEHSSGLTTFVMDGWDAGKLSQPLQRQARISVRVIPHYNALRIATAHFNNQADLDVLMATLDDLASKGNTHES